MTQNKASPISGLEVIFNKSRGKFKVDNIEKYNDEVQSLLNEKILYLYNQKPKKYLKKVKIN